MPEQVGSKEELIVIRGDSTLWPRQAVFEQPLRFHTCDVGFRLAPSLIGREYVRVDSYGVCAGAAARIALLGSDDRLVQPGERARHDRIAASNSKAAPLVQRARPVTVATGRECSRMAAHRTAGKHSGLSFDSSGTAPYAVDGIGDSVFDPASNLSTRTTLRHTPSDAEPGCTT